MDINGKAPVFDPEKILKNPTAEQRHMMTKDALIKAGRPEDYEYIVKYLSPPVDITTYAEPGQYRSIKVAVVGAGIAGLATAFELRKLGFDITIFDPEDQRIGGRIYTHYFNNDENLYGELGAARVPATHEATWHYINLFNLSTTRFTRTPDTLVYVRGVRAWNNPKDIMEKIYPLFDLTPSERSTPWPDIYNRVVQSAVKSVSPEARAETLQIKPRYSLELVRVVAKSVYQALKDARLSDTAISMITSLSPVVNAFIFGDFDTEFVTEYALSLRNLYRIDGGMVNLPLAFCKSLSSDNPQEYSQPQYTLGKITWKLGNLVTRCYRSNRNGKVGIWCLSKEMPEGSVGEFDYVIFTIPLTAMRKVLFFPSLLDLKTEALREAFYVDAAKTLFLCNERFWERQGITGGSTNTDLVIQSIFYPPDDIYCKQGGQGMNVVCSPNRPGVLTAAYNIGNDATRLGNMKTFRFQMLKTMVERVHGLPEDYLDRVVADHITVNWNRNEWITGGFINPLPGQSARFGFGLSRPDFDNRLYFAGEAVTPPHGWIQAALRSAMIAANALAYYLKTYGYR